MSMKEQAKHTPGPWHAHYQYADGKEHLPNIDADAGPGIATMEPYGTREQQIADARLIAAAPELLEVLNDATPCPGAPGHFPINSRDLHDWFTRYWNWQKQREAAIAKAEGRLRHGGTGGSIPRRKLSR
jgi:hypothetical protein